MQSLLSNLKININEKIYLKDPESSALGKRIVENSILLIDELGFDAFTFKKLGAKIGSNESSIYRYFESKHNVLIYLTSWYWTWLEYQLVFTTNSIENPIQKIEKAIVILTRNTVIDSDFSHINEVLLKQIVINEYSKSYLTKEVDEENKDGYFKVYKRLVTRLHDMILAVDANYTYAFSLASTVIDGALHQHFLKDHFTTISDLKPEESPTNYFKDLVFKSLNISTHE
ncbi:TetR/AcrR family transcriptional regulator [Olleya aquimaris]|uniref:TetR/AcrR family transcriptional regulator n=1 Tax=Olleya sediminilitoris TaxID=2795739 RepID=A0ABS1WIM9_9FLAO|nr:TetR/AcrR family transcriptional regulator [Olleya sediminilitoris]AXO79288.1 TetR/AcrR family transcriptional regulator [Olleya aquimaris]MBL7558947.1 TetR/AcrR family transcriptional regulator [Olleya sediminilitoris]